MKIRFVPQFSLVALFALFAAAPLFAAEPATAIKFQFGAEKAASGYTLVSSALQYSKETGYGFESGANVTNVIGKSFFALHRGAMASSQPFFFSVAVPEGNYRVTVTLGDPKADAVTTVKAETRRLMLERIRTAAGKFVTRTFMVNVRNPKISTGGEVNLDSREMNLTTHEAISRDWDDKLTLEFSDSHPALAALKVEKVNDAVTLFVCGDSTVTDQPGWPASSWGQMVTRWFKSKVVVANHAESGETLKGFLKERRWDKVLDSVRPGDYVIIEFGCNDSKKSGPQNIYPGQDFSETYVDADTTYKELLKRFAVDVQEQGAFPIIVSPSARRQDVAKPGSLQAYADAAMAAAKESGMPSIDLNSMGVDINDALGADGPKQFGDQTHHVEYGSYLQSKCIALGIQQAKLPLAKFIVSDFGHFDPKHPEPLPASFNLPPDPRLGRAGRAARSQTSWTISSPAGSVQATIQLTNLNGTADYPDSTRLYYSVSLTNPVAVEVVPASPMGLVRSDANFVDGLSFVSESPEVRVDSTYTMVAGKRKVCRDFCNEKTLTFASTHGPKLEIVLRAYNEGFAFRYVFPETDTNACTVIGEETGIRMPDKSVAWMMPYDQFTNGKYQPAYENYWNNAIPVGTLSTAVPSASSPPSGWALPALFQTPSRQYALFFETDVTESYCGSHLGEPTNDVYRIAEPLAPEGAGRGSVNPSYPLPWMMPWRVVVVGATPAPILENTLAFDLASPSTIADVSWIKPGRSSWSWWSDSNTHNYQTHIAFVDLAQQMGWEYCLLDGGWQTITNGGDWQSVLKYATDRNVGITVWFTSGANGAPSVLMDPATRKAEFDMLSAAGVKGVKIDFFHSDKQWTMKYYLDILKDAAADHLLVDFHGCTIGRGWQRTYPNLMSMEAVRGAEYYKSHATYPPGEPARNTILPFTRNSLMSMDYTPVTFSNNRHAHITTYGHELALSVIFESGIQHFADRVSGYSTNTISPAARTFLQQVPVTWDDTKYLLGTPGTFVVLARQKGSDWYIGGISGEATGRTVTVPLTFLASGASYRMTRIADGESDTTFDEQIGSVTAVDSITLPMRANGGFVARLTIAPQ